MKNTVFCEKVATIEPQGSISAANADIFKEQLIETIASQKTPFLLINMERVEFLDSAGLMALVAAYRLAKSLNRRLSLCSIPPSVRIIFELTQLEDTFEIFENPQGFLAAVG